MDQVGLSYNKALDGLRGLAILLVLMDHTQLIRFGWIGVQLFFVLSGFLITTILLKEKEKPVPLKTQFRNFWVRRVLRIFPLYYLYLFFLIILWWLSSDLSVHSPKLPWLFTYTFNFSGLLLPPKPYYLTGHLWSLSVEEQFYIIYPFVVLLCNRKQLKFAAILLILFSIFFRFFRGQYLFQSGMPDAHVGGTIYSSTFSHFDAFLLGGSIAIFHLYRLPLKARHFIFWALLATTLGAGLLVYLQIKPGPFNFNDYITHLGYVPEFVQWYFYVWSYLLIDLFFASLLLLLVSPDKKGLSFYLDRSFAFSPLVKIGIVSYGMYIIHMGIRHLVAWIARGQHINNKYLLFMINLSVVFGLAWIIYQLYERRFLLMKEKFR